MCKYNSYLIFFYNDILIKITSNGITKYGNKQKKMATRSN